MRLSKPRIPQIPVGKTNYVRYSWVSTKLDEGEVPIAPQGSASQLRPEVDTKPGRVDANDCQVSRLRRISARALQWAQARHLVSSSHLLDCPKFKTLWRTSDNGSRRSSSILEAPISIRS